MRNTYSCLLFLIASGLSQAVYADQRSDTGFYLAAGVAASIIDPGPNFLDDETNLVPRLSAAWRITPYLGIETSYLDFGDAPYPLVSGSANSISGYSLAVSGRWPLSPDVAMYVKAGQLWWATDLDVTSCSRLGGCTRHSVDYSDNDWLLGIGASYEISDRLGLEFEYDFLDFKFHRDFQRFNNETSTLSLMLVMKI